MESREIVEDLYESISVYTRIAIMDVARAITPGLFLTGCIGISLATFLALADFHLGFPLRTFYAFVSALTAAILFEQAYEGVTLTRESQGIIARFLSVKQLYFQGMPWKDRDARLKRAKAFRPICIPIGGFCNVSMSVIQVVWEEILNHILFLFSL